MATVKEITHDSSTTIGDFYDTVLDVDGSISVSTGDALNGSVNGVGFDYDNGTNEGELTEGFTDLSGNDLRIRIYLDVSGLTGSHSISIFGFHLFSDETGARDTMLTVRMDGDGAGGFDLTYQTFNDEGAVDGTVAGVALTGVHCIDVSMVKEVSDGSDDGQAEFFLDGVSKGSAATIGNFTNWGAGIDGVLTEFPNPGSPSVGGTIKYDEMLLTDDSTTALCGGVFSGYDLVVGGGQP